MTVAADAVSIEFAMITAMYWLTVAAFAVTYLILAVALVRTFDPGRSYLLQLIWAVDDLLFYGPGSGKPPL